MAELKSTPASDAWRALLGAFTSIHDELADELLEQTGVHIVHYEILLLLYEAGEDGIRPSEIAERRQLSRSGATRLIDKLEANGIVERRSCGDDRRGNVVVLGEEGRKTFTKAGRVHLAGIERLVGERLSNVEMVALQEILAKLAPQ